MSQSRDYFCTRSLHVESLSVDAYSGVTSQKRLAWEVGPAKTSTDGVVVYLLLMSDQYFHELRAEHENLERGELEWIDTIV